MLVGGREARHKREAHRSRLAAAGSTGNACLIAAAAAMSHAHALFPAGPADPCCQRRGDHVASIRFCSRIDWRRFAAAERRQHLPGFVRPGVCSRTSIAVWRAIQLSQAPEQQARSLRGPGRLEPCLFLAWQAPQLLQRRGEGSIGGRGPTLTAHMAGEPGSGGGGASGGSGRVQPEEPLPYLSHDDSQEFVQMADCEWNRE